MTQAAALPSNCWQEAGAARSSGLERLVVELGDACRLPPASQGDRIRGALSRAVLLPDLVPPAQTRPHPDCYVRHVIHADPGHRFTVLALIWAPGQQSPVHAHVTWCAFAVRTGRLTETLFAFDRPQGDALARTTHERGAGYACYAPEGLELGHRLVNTGEETAISIHVYGVGADHIATGVNKVFDFA